MAQSEYGVGGGRAVVGVVEMSLDATGTPIAATNGIQNFVAMTAGTLYSAGAYVQIICTVAGNVVLQMANGVNNTIPVTVGLTLLPYAVTKIVTSGTTATATYANLY